MRHVPLAFHLLPSLAYRRLILFLNHQLVLLFVLRHFREGPTPQTRCSRILAYQATSHVIMAPRQRVLAPSESKSRFLQRLGLNDNNEAHRRIYNMMKVFTQQHKF